MPFAVIDNMSPDRTLLTGYIPEGADSDLEELKWELSHPAFLEVDDALRWSYGTVSRRKGRGTPTRRGFSIRFDRPLTFDDLDHRHLGVEVTTTDDEPRSVTGLNPVTVDRTFVYRAMDQERSAEEDDELFARTLSPEVEADVRAARTSRVAVLVHCFYGDVLEMVLDHLERMAHVPHDLFVDVPEDRVSEINGLASRRPDARVFVVPNRGRDILPFLRVAPFLERCGYESLLKVHTKKSPTSTIGPAWLRAILRALIPEDPAVLDQVLDALAQPTTSLIGPERYYYPLSYGASAGENMYNLNLVLRSRIPQLDPVALAEGFYAQYGFFAGTMFWTRLDALESIYDIPTAQIEQEPLATDGMLAHSLERLFGLVPPLTGRTMYSVRVDGHPDPFRVRPPATKSPMRPLS